MISVVQEEDLIVQYLSVIKIKRPAELSAGLVNAGP